MTSDDELLARADKWLALFNPYKAITPANSADLIESLSTSLRELLKEREEWRKVIGEARESINVLHEQGHWDNGVYGPSGESEGEIMTTRFVNEIVAKLAALAGSGK